ncbi:MAG: F0F1 ATP synthase subunit B' [Campylobacterales bacterium]|nr:F0F1 ATP synthase subunit B' [Campylobacterales bacterium]
MLDISPALLLMAVAVFLVMLILLNKVLYRPLLEFVQNRNNSIASDYENAGKNTSDISAYQEEAERILREAKTEAAKIRAEVIQESKDAALKKIEQRKAELEEEYVAFLEGLDKERIELKNGLLAQMPLFKEGIQGKLNQI